MQVHLQVLSKHLILKTERDWVFNRHRGLVIKRLARGAIMRIVDVQSNGDQRSDADIVCRTHELPLSLRRDNGNDFTDIDRRPLGGYLVLPCQYCVRFDVGKGIAVVLTR